MNTISRSIHVQFRVGSQPPSVVCSDLRLHGPEGEPVDLDSTLLDLFFLTDVGEHHFLVAEHIRVDLIRRLAEGLSPEAADEARAALLPGIVLPINGGSPFSGPAGAIR